MKLRIDHPDLAAAVSYAARSLPVRPPAPVLAGLLLTAGTDQLRVSGFDYEVSADAAVPAVVSEPGRALVSGRLLADIAGVVRGDVQLTVEGPRLILNAGSARFTLPMLPLEEYPALPEPGDPSGTLSGGAFAEAVTQVATAVSRDDSVPVLTGISLVIDSGARTLTLSSTDRYRFAVRTLEVKDLSPDLPLDSALIPAKPLLDAAKAAADDPAVDLSLPGGHGILSLSGDHSATTIRAMGGEFPDYTKLFPTAFAYTATVDTAALTAAVKRVSLVATKDSPLRLHFADNSLRLEAGTSDDAQALDNVDTSLDGDELTVAFNPTFLLDGLTALGTEQFQFQFTSPTKPAVLRGAGTNDRALRYLLMPIRLTN
ncbi:DNA polymerase III subunit beta [Streptomyces sp. NPDC060366]|uniref:DNA polymerase III subunit beta n=1 Tax=Streptomyces sp. NPDC060366 TaxID=3347105 RepID=UPI00364CCC01